ncbi:MAG: Ribosomal protein S11 [Candidatus Yanofskybacteria bacterium GW2011_GWA1_48_10]|uniref:Small ribosomal subunit protein uS11 n=1 Tax=Candidatus Yanofskybacteria bacterium GW2011_GWA1_48_10 TaxID=1619022 RepID=A0A0G1WIQ9_9BACT|nr:MAG: Ribosomal protein S11 [Candidatus Yanofskybacteria bacterium GW2011_GWA1_48_10]
MGKSKLAEQSVENITEPSEAPVSVPVKKSSAKKQVINGVATVNVSYNNTLISIGDSKGEVIAWSSAGLLGFKGSKKSTPYAANMVARDCFEKTKKYNLANIKIVIKGVGPGRESAIRGLAGTGLNILSIMDKTPIAHNGCRRPKPRRV